MAGVLSLEAREMQTPEPGEPFAVDAVLTALEDAAAQPRAMRRGPYKKITKHDIARAVALRNARPGTEPAGSLAGVTDEDVARARAKLPPPGWTPTDEESEWFVRALAWDMKRRDMLERLARIERDTEVQPASVRTPEDLRVVTDGYPALARERRNLLLALFPDDADLCAALERYE